MLMKRMKKTIILSVMVMMMSISVGCSSAKLDLESDGVIDESKLNVLQKETVDNARNESFHDQLIVDIEKAIDKALENELLLSTIKDELEMIDTRSGRESAMKALAEHMAKELEVQILEDEYDQKVSTRDLYNIIEDIDLIPYIFNNLHGKMGNLLDGVNKMDRDVKMYSNNDFGVGSANKEFLEALEEFDSKSNSLYSDDIDKSVSFNEADGLFREYINENFGEECIFDTIPTGGNNPTTRRAEVLFIDANGKTKKVALLEMDLTSGEINVIEKY